MTKYLSPAGIEPTLRFRKPIISPGELGIFLEMCALCVLWRYVPIRKVGDL
jgi:hypothetical protein